MSIATKYRDDNEFHSIVGGIVDLIHEPRTYEWVNKMAEAQLKHQGIDNIPDDIYSPEYQVFVDNQVHFLRDVVIAVLDKF